MIKKIALPFDAPENFAVARLKFTTVSESDVSAVIAISAYRWCLRQWCRPLSRILNWLLASVVADQFRVLRK
jgi:hypothetical protein